MAGDLIPPPSPAGDGNSPETRQDAATPLTEISTASGSTITDFSTAGAGGVQGDLVAGSAAINLRTRSEYRGVFTALAVALVATAVSSAAIAGLLLRHERAQPGPTWSSWKPGSKDAFVAAKQIAAHVAPKYRLKNGDQLVAVEGGSLSVADLPFSIAMRSGTNGSDIKLLEGKGVLYTLNGLGAGGSIAKGKPSERRHLLLRREALELALYTFRYAPSVDLVVTLLPPKPLGKSDSSSSSSTTSEPTQALLFRSKDLKKQLAIPVVMTIPPKTPRAETIPLKEASKIERLTRARLFLASFQQSQDAQAFLVLDPLK